MTPDVAKLGDQIRSINAGITSVDTAARTMDISFSSEAPAEQSFGREVLSHAPGACDLTKLNAGAPLLYQHIKTDVRGVVENARIDHAARRGLATVRFGKGQKAEELFNDVKDRIIRGVSVGYTIRGMKQTGGTAKRPEYTVTNWQPHEITITPFPADLSVGVARETGHRTLYAQPKEHGNMLDNTFSAVRHLIDANAPEMKNYSLARAFASFRGTGGRPNDCPELDLSDQIAKAMGRSTAGFFIPTNLPAPEGQRTTSTTAYAATTGSQGGGNLVATNLLSGSFIDVLRNKARVIQAGATVLPGLVGNVAIPRQDVASTAYWLSPEGADITESEGTFSQITMMPRTIGVYSQVTRQMLLQSTPNMEILVRNDFAKTLALGIDLAAIAGTGAGGQPIGILNVAGINTVSIGGNGGNSSIDNLIALETAVTASNIDDDAMSYLTNSTVVGGWKLLKDSTGRYLWTENILAGQYGQRTSTPGSINGYPVFRSNQVPKNLTKGTGTGLSAISFGNWSDLIIGEWGVLEIEQSFGGAGFKSGTIEFRAMQSVDIRLRHATSFAVITDAVQ